jgi:AcrR family transcriptional regulator
MGSASNRGSADQAIRSRDNTRAALIRAGRRMFLATELENVSIDRVARAAGFTRAAFYLHFAGRDELIAAIMLAEAERPVPIFRWFESHPRDAPSIEAFLHHYLEASRAFHLHAFHQAALKSAAASEAFQRNRAHLTSVLGGSFPGFRPQQDDTPDELARVARATGIMIRLEQLALREFDLAGPLLGEAMIQDLKAAMLALDADYPV